jgi:TetR/AcrR family transcriptional regulator
MTEQISTEKQAVILDAARKRFAYYGFSKVTMDEIASDVGMGKASLYYYFPTKEGLFHEVIKQEKEQFLDNIRKMIEQKFAPCDMLREYASKRVEYFRNLANLRALQFQQSAETRASFLELFKDFQHQEVALLQEVLEIGKRAGEFEIRDTHQSAEIIMQMFYGPRAWLLLKRENRLDDDTYRALEESARQIAEVILNGIRTRN